MTRTKTAVFLISIALAPCYAGKVQTYASPSVDFASYKTYQWVPTKVLGKSGIVEDDPTFTPVIKEAVNRELTARGMKEVPDGGDLEVVTLALGTSIPQLEALIFPIGVTYDYPEPMATIGRYNREGTFAINLIDRKTKKSAWAGMIKETINTNPGAGVKKIPKATESLFKKYPIKK